MIDKIKCPNCSHEFDVEEALSGKLQAHFKAEYEQKITKQAEVFRKEEALLEQKRKEFESKKEKANEMFKEKLEKGIAIEKSKIHQKTQEVFEDRMKILEEENQQKKEENRKLRRQEIEILKKEKELKEQAEEMELQLQKEMLERQKSIEDKARLKERESMQLKEKEYQKQLDDQKKLIDEMKRKAEQGSMQMQGEVQELALEELLASSYPFDQITEVPKGIRGADCIQKVVNSAQNTCGSIVYESKRTKNFTNDWIEKLKQDQISCKADIAVIVTQTLPTGMNRFGEKDGVWICGFHEVKSLSFVLRQILIKTSAAQSAQVNKGDKMELMYNYLTSNEFVQNIKRIVENYDNMVLHLNKEKKAMMKMWAIREKQIWIVQENISSLFGSIKGIAGNELESTSIMELPDYDNEELE